MSLHAGKPWRNVVHIDEQTGSRGGKCWVLTLDCGHTAFRAQPNPTPEQLIARMMPPLIDVATKLRPFRMTAPYRVRCLHCPTEGDPT